MAKCFWLLKREQSYWSKCAASFTLNIRISSMSEVLFRKSNFAHKLILKTYLNRMYLAFFQQFWLLHFQKHTHMLMPIFEILPLSGPLWGGVILFQLYVTGWTQNVRCSVLWVRRKVRNALRKQKGERPHKKVYCILFQYKVKAAFLMNYNWSMVWL